MVLTVSVEWKVKTYHKFNAVAYGKLFKKNKESIVAVGEDGVVQVFDIPASSSEKGKTLTITPVRNFETKCGPASHILLKDITRLSPCDMLVADTRGAVVLFCDGQILVRQCSLSGKTSRVTALEVQETGLGSVQVIVGKDDGELTCFNTFSVLWKLRLSDLSKEKMMKTISVTCILATPIVTSAGDVGDYILVSDSAQYLHIIENGEVLSSVYINSVVTTMVAGNFLHTEDIQRQSNQATQIALGCMDGCVWIMADFSVDISAPYVNIGHPITHLRRIPSKHNHVFSVTSGEENGLVDLLLCGGHFHSIKVLQYGKSVYSLPLSTWPIAITGLKDWMDTELREQDAVDNSILIGCQDSTLQCVTIT